MPAGLSSVCSADSVRALPDSKLCQLLSKFLRQLQLRTMLGGLLPSSQQLPALRSQHLQLWELPVRPEFTVGVPVLRGKPALLLEEQQLHGELLQGRTASLQRLPASHPFQLSPLLLRLPPQLLPRSCLIAMQALHLSSHRLQHLLLLHYGKRQSN